MRTEFNQVKVVSSSEVGELFIDFNVWDVIDLNNGKSIVFYTPKTNELDTDTMDQTLM